MLGGAQSVLWDNDLRSTKHTLKEMIMHYSNLELSRGKGRQSEPHCWRALVRGSCIAARGLGMGGAARLRSLSFAFSELVLLALYYQGLRVHDGKKLLWLCMLSTNLDTGLPPSSVPRHTVGAVHPALN